MFNISPEILTALMLGGVLVGVLTGYPLAFIVGILALVFGYIAFGDAVIKVLYVRMFGLITTYVILAAPLFIFMGAMIERSGIAAGMYKALYLWLGGLRGGLAAVTVLIGTILAASVGIIGASVTMLTLIALPSMIQRGYSKSIASGAVCAGGTLGILIPPSVMLVIYGPTAGVSVGKLFMGAFMPGFLLSVCYISYILIRCYFQPMAGPSVPPEERRVPFSRKTIMLASSMLPPVILILSVLGTIYFGIAPPTEAAAMGAICATILAIAYRRFSWRVLREATMQTVKITSMIILIGSMAFMYTGVFIGAGCGDVLKEVISDAPGGKWGAFGMIMFIVFILGYFIDWIGIIFILVPIITPISSELGFNPVWFSIMMCINLQTSFMTPPFAGAIFFLKGAAAPELGVTMGDIIRGVFPFIGLILLTLGLCVVFPQIILWLPSQMIR